MHVYTASLPNGWEDTMKCPSWFDTHTRGCPHPNGVVIAGSTQIKQHGMKVELLDLWRKGTKHLPNLGYPVTDVGMTYDVGTGMLTVAGGDRYDNEGGSQTLSNKVFQLSVPRGGATSPAWETLIDLPCEVARPISQTVFMLSIAINRAEHVCATVIIKHNYMLMCNHKIVINIMLCLLNSTGHI